jgi:hypothetical protein
MNTTLDRDALERILTKPVADALLRSRGEPITATEVEGFLRDALLSLYRTIATPAATTAQPFEYEESEITIEAKEDPQPDRDMLPGIEEQEPVTDFRHTPRYIPRRQIDGTFKRVRFSIVQISDTGLRIRHDEAILPGDDGKLSFALLNPPRSFVMQAHVVWTSMARYGEDGDAFWISGIRATQHGERLREALALLREAHQLEPERRAKPRVGVVPLPAGGVEGASDEDIAAVINAANRFAANPTEAIRWYARAKFALTEPHVRKNAPQRMRDREEVLGIWEYLDRRVDIPTISGVISWMRKARGRTGVL